MGVLKRTRTDALKVSCCAVDRLDCATCSSQALIEHAAVYKQNQTDEAIAQPWVADTTGVASDLLCTRVIDAWHGSVNS